MNKTELIRILNTNIVNLCKQKHSLKKKFKSLIKKQSSTICHEEDETRIKKVELHKAFSNPNFDKDNIRSQAQISYLINEN